MNTPVTSFICDAKVYKVQAFTPMVNTDRMGNISLGSFMKLDDATARLEEDGSVGYGNIREEWLYVMVPVINEACNWNLARVLPVLNVPDMLASPNGNQAFVDPNGNNLRFYVNYVDPAVARKNALAKLTPDERHLLGLE